MNPPCEIVSNRIIPNVRAILAKDLSNRYDYSQSEIANRLGITQPAVSQYLHSGKDMRKIKNSLREIEMYQKLKELSDLVAENKTDGNKITKKYCKICRSMGKEEVKCILNLGNASQISEEEYKKYLDSK